MALTGGQSTLAYPVYKTEQDVFLVPATHSDFRVFCTYQGRTNAHRATTRFEKAVVTPGYSSPRSCISVKMVTSPHEVLKQCVHGVQTTLEGADWEWRGKPLEIRNTGHTTLQLKLGEKASRAELGAEPDGALRVAEAEFPFFILEVRRTQTEIICILEINDQDPTGCQVLATIIKPVKVDAPTAEKNPDRYRVEELKVIDKEQIYPARSQKAFIITREEMLPKDSVDDGNPDAHVSIKLRVFESRAREAAAEFLRPRPADGRSNSYDPNQESRWSPASSVRSEPESESRPEDS
ncbi:MAG: hypothetical protein LQ346_006665 [Caloplaca aetnensis]|nr:MAG: hypothetical protein LQ346_006665 [Caloplaca aetnensis]